MELGSNTSDGGRWWCECYIFWVQHLVDYVGEDPDSVAAWQSLQAKLKVNTRTRLLEECVLSYWTRYCCGIAI